jgi:hypothetical protein
MTFMFNYDSVKQLRPCPMGFNRAIEALGGIENWKEKAFSFHDMAEAGIPFNDLFWLAVAYSLKSPLAENRLRRFLLDCIAVVVPVYESFWNKDKTIHDAIETIRSVSSDKTLEKLGANSVVEPLAASLLEARLRATPKGADAAILRCFKYLGFTGAGFKLEGDDIILYAHFKSLVVETRNLREVFLNDDNDDTGMDVDIPDYVLWQLNRLCQYMSDSPPEDWPIGQDPL